MATNIEPIQIKPFFGGFILETLTVGMYGESRNAIREYVQNAFDSIQHAINSLKIVAPGHGLISITMGGDGNSLVIRDNGAGLTVRSAVATLTSVGASGKDYKNEAGFRGIGRLAGIVFSDTVTFTTKARGERQQTTVVFHGDKMRAAMTPSKGGTQSAEDLITSCVDAHISEADDPKAHFFEVRLDGFEDAPEECTSFQLMRAFISQVAPVPYNEKFPFRAELRAAEQKTGLSIEEVRIELKDQAGEPESIFKPYTDAYEMDEGPTRLTECEIKTGPNWWAWIGKKAVSGSYGDSRVLGLRVRMKNIQIDGTDVFREIFKQQAKSYIRFQDWYVGEVFVRPSALVPNARRDGFEENVAWKTMRKQLGDLARELGSQAYEISDSGQFTLAALEQKVGEVAQDYESMERGDFKSVDRTLKFAADITKLQRGVARASKNASIQTLAKLQLLASELIDYKAKAIQRIGADKSPRDTEEIRQESRTELLAELMMLFESELPAPCLAAVRNLLAENY